MMISEIFQLGYDRGGRRHRHHRGYFHRHYFYDRRFRRRFRRRFDDDDLLSIRITL